MDYQSAHCWACGRMAIFDPIEVPRVNGRPLCKHCATRVNELLAEAGHRGVEFTDSTYANSD